MPLKTTSVIIGTYNCARFLPGLFACLATQTYRDFEVVVVDDASTDGETLAFLRKQGNRIRLIERNQNSATCELPRYHGVKNAVGKYCAFLDADDRWDPTFLEKTVAYLDSNLDIPLVHTYARVIDDANRALRIRHEGNIPYGQNTAQELLRHCFITVSAVLVRREVWLHALHEEDITDFGMDQDFFVAIARNHPIGFIPEVLASYRRSVSSVSVKKWKRIPRNVNTLERLLHKGAWRGIADRREMVDILADAYLQNADYWRTAEAPAKACWFCLHGLRHRPFSARLWKAFAGAALACLGLRKPRLTSIRLNA